MYFSHALGHRWPRRWLVRARLSSSLTRELAKKFWCLRAWRESSQLVGSGQWTADSGQQTVDSGNLDQLAHIQLQLLVPLPLEAADCKLVNPLVRVWTAVPVGDGRLPDSQA